MPLQHLERTGRGPWVSPPRAQVITGSYDKTIRMYDIRKPSTISTLTYHKKSVRALTQHPRQYAFASGGADNIKKFSLPTGEFLHNMLQEQRAIINSLSLNEEGVVASGGDNGSLWCALSPHGDLPVVQGSPRRVMPLCVGLPVVQGSLTCQRAVSLAASTALPAWSRWFHHAPAHMFTRRAGSGTGPAATTSSRGRRSCSPARSRASAASSRPRSTRPAAAC